MRFRLDPTPEQEAALRDHCAHARFVWNLALEQKRSPSGTAPTAWGVASAGRVTPSRTAS